MEHFSRASSHCGGISIVIPVSPTSSRRLRSCARRSSPDTAGLPGLIRPVPRRLCETARTGHHLSNLFEKLVGREWFRENSLIQRTTSRLPVVADQQDGSRGEQLSRCNSQLQSIHAAGKVERCNE